VDVLRDGVASATVYMIMGIGLCKQEVGLPFAIKKRQKNKAFASLTFFMSDTKAFISSVL
jgi:hypothetical protein